jgi:metal-responsive CopG/Arc/MetJ family transcriptional regulator
VLVKELPKANENFKGVSIKKSLYQEVKDFVDEDSTYKSVAEFVSEAIRLRLQQVKACKAQI